MEILTIKEAGISEIEIKKSRFITNIFRISDEAEARDTINRISKEHYKANHNCYAYVIGDNNEIQRQSDNGEPSGTAGVPILEVIKKNNLKNIGIVVTRYFGGIKLGAGGLIRAYSNSASNAIENIGIVKLVLMKKLHLGIEYNQVDKLTYYLNNHAIPISNTEYTDQVTITVAIENSLITSFQNEIIELLNGHVQFKLANDEITEVPYTK